MTIKELIIRLLDCLAENGDAPVMMEGEMGAVDDLQKEKDFLQDGEYVLLLGEED